MEFGPPKPEEDDDDEEETVDDFSVERNNWLLFSDRLKNLFSIEEEHDEDEDDEEADPKKKRSKKLVGLFRRHNFATKAVKESALSESLESEEKLTQIDRFTDTIEAQAPQRVSDKFEIVPRDIKDEPDNVVIEQSVVDLGDTEIRTTSVDIELPSILDASPEDSVEDISFSIETNLSDQSLASSDNIETRSAKTESKSANVAPAVVGSLIIDKLSRNADKRISKQAEELRERVERLENEYAVDKIEHTKTDKKAKTEQERMRLQVDKLRADKIVNSFDRPIQAEKDSNKKATSVSIESRPDTKMPAESPSLGIEQIIQLVDSAEIPQDKVERGVAQEIYDERQFEIKDEASTPDTNPKGGSSRHGSGDAYQEQSLRDIAMIKESLENSKGLIDQSDRDNSQTMKVAALTGAVTALVIIAGFIVMSWLL